MGNVQRHSDKLTDWTGRRAQIAAPIKMNQWIDMESRNNNLQNSNNLVCKTIEHSPSVKYQTWAETENFERRKNSEKEHLLNTCDINK